MDDISRIFRSVLLVAQLEPDGIPARLKAARKACGREMTQERVADLLGVHKRTVENDEKTATSGVWERLNAYARIYGLPVERLLWGEDVDLTGPDGPMAHRLEELEAKVEYEGQAMARALRALAKEVRALAPQPTRATPRAKKAAQ